MLKIIFFLSINVLKFMFFFLLVNGILSLCAQLSIITPALAIEKKIQFFGLRFFFNIREEKLGVQRNC